MKKKIAAVAASFVVGGILAKVIKEVKDRKEEEIVEVEEDELSE